MKRLVAIILVLCLCIVYSDAQTHRVILPSDSIGKNNSIGINNAVELDSLKKTYYRRVYERIHDISDHLNYTISPNRKESDRRYYALLIQNRFHPEAIITVKTDTIICSYNLHKYVQRLATSYNISKIYIDSIAIPHWNSLVIANDTLGMVISEHEMIPLRPNRHFENGKRGLPIIKEETEDGDEWTPMLFGNMIVTIAYKNENNSKNNRSSLDVISNKLH